MDKRDLNYRTKLFNDAKTRLFQEYSLALDKTWIEKPISYALYQTWKWMDKKEKAREVQNDS